MKKWIRASLLLTFLIGCALPAVAGGSRETAASAAHFQGAALVQPNSSDPVLARGLPQIHQSGAVTVFTPWLTPKEKKANDAVKRLFNSYYPNVRLTYQYMSANNIQTVASSRLVAGNPPLAVDGPTGMFMINFAREGALVDLTPLWKKYGLAKLFPEGIVQASEYHGKFYSIPIFIASHAYFWWNKRLFEKAGVPQPPYATWSEFFSAAKLFTQRTHLPFVSIGMEPSTVPFELAVYLAAKRYGLGLAYRVLNGTATENDFRELLAFFHKYAQYAEPGASSVDATFGPGDQVAAGQAATGVSGQWVLNAMVKQHLVAGKDYGRAYLPGPSILYYNLGGVFVFKGNGKEDIGKAFAAVAASRQGELLFSEKGAVPARYDATLPKSFEPLIVSTAKYAKKATLLPIPNVAVPPEVQDAYGPEIVNFLIGQKSEQATAAKLFAIEKKYRSSFVLHWGPKG